MEFKRVDIKTGYLCNNNCKFCVQAHNKKFANKNSEEIIASLKSARDDNCSGVVFTGGEFTLRDDCIKLVHLAKQLGFSTIQLQSNGRMFSNIDFCKKMISAGANEFSPALHGHSAEIHDYLTESPGAFKQTVQGIRNIKQLGQYIVANSVIVKANYRTAPLTAQLFADLNVDQFQFAFVHAMGNAQKNFKSMIPNKSLVVPYLKKGIDIAVKNGVKVMVEAIPFCLMQGYEKYVSELYIPPTRIEEKDRVILDFKKAKQEFSKVKFSQCKTCRFDIVCEGPWREYPEAFGSDEFVAIPGTPVTCPEDIIQSRIKFR